MKFVAALLAVISNAQLDGCDPNLPVCWDLQPRDANCLCSPLPLCKIQSCADEKNIVNSDTAECTCPSEREADCRYETCSYLNSNDQLRNEVDCTCPTVCIPNSCEDGSTPQGPGCICDAEFVPTTPCWTDLDENGQCPSCENQFCWDGQPRSDNEECSCNFCAAEKD